MEMWYERHLRMRAGQPAVIRFLLWVGFVKFGRKSNVIDLDIYVQTGRYEYLYPEAIVWPFDAPSWPSFKWHLRCPGQRVYVFRNLPGVIKWLPGRLLPMRWGFGICGFEFGDRG